MEKFRMKKIFLLLMLGLAAFGAFTKVWASARVDSMAADPREVDDNELIWLYPNQVVNYKGMVDFRLAPNETFGAGVSEWGGVVFEPSPDLGTWALYVNRPTLEASPLAGTYEPFFPSMLGFNQRPTSNFPLGLYQNQFDLFWGKEMGDAGLGLHFTYGSAFPAIDNLGFSAGLQLPNVGPFNKLNLHADYAFLSFGDQLGATNNGTFTGKLGALASSDLDKDLALRPFVDLQMDQFKFTGISVPGNLDYSDFGADFGLALNRKLNDGKGLVSTGLIFDYLGTKNSDGSLFPAFTIDTWTVVWNASLEYPVADWLTLRTGLAKALVARVYDQNDLMGNGTYWDGSNDNAVYTVGFGIQWRNFVLNANVNTAQFETSLHNLQPGNGIFFNNGTPLAQVASADLQYKF